MNSDANNPAVLRPVSTPVCGGFRRTQLYHLGLWQVFSIPALIGCFTTEAQSASLLYQSDATYSRTAGGFTVYGGVMTGLGFNSDSLWNVQSVLITVDFSFDYSASSAELQIVGTAPITTQQSLHALPITIGPIIEIRPYGDYYSRNVSIQTGNLFVPPGSHFLGLSFNGTGSGAFWAGYKFGGL